MSSPRAERCGGHSRCIVFFLDWLYYENKLVLSSFFLSTRAYSISPDHISRSQCDCLCHVTTTDPVAKPLMSHTGHKTHAQRRPYVDLMDVQCLHLPVAPGISSGQALDGLDFGLYVIHNFHSRGSLTVRQLRVPASVISATL